MILKKFGMGLNPVNMLAAVQIITVAMDIGILKILQKYKLSQQTKEENHV